MKYETGRGGIAQNEREAARLYRRASNLDDAKSQIKLRLMYLEGRGIPRNDTAAALLFFRAAKLRDANGEYFSAVLAHKGQGRP